MPSTAVTTRKSALRKSDPFRVKSRTPLASRRAMMREAVVLNPHELSGGPTVALWQGGVSTALRCGNVYAWNMKLDRDTPQANIAPP